MGAPPHEKPVVKDSFAELLEIVKTGNPFSPRQTPSPIPVTKNGMPRRTEHTEELRNFSSGSIDLIDLASHEQRAAVTQSSFLVKDYFMSGANGHGDGSGCTKFVRQSDLINGKKVEKHWNDHPDVNHSGGWAPKGLQEFQPTMDTRYLEKKQSQIPVLEGLKPRYLVPPDHAVTPESSNEDKLEHLFNLLNAIKSEPDDVTTPEASSLEDVTEYQGNNVSANLVQTEQVDQPKPLEKEIVALKIRESELLANIEKLERKLSDAHTQNIFLSTENTQLRGKAARSSPKKPNDLEEKLKEKTTEASRLQNENHQLKHLLRTKDATISNLEKQVDRLSDNGKIYRNAAHLVKPSDNANIPRTVVACMECYSKNSTCDSKTKCHNCTESGSLCLRWRCSQFHVHKRCESQPCRLYHNSDGWVMLKQARPEW